MRGVGLSASELAVRVHVYIVHVYMSPSPLIPLAPGNVKPGQFVSPSDSAFHSGVTTTTSSVVGDEDLEQFKDEIPPNTVISQPGPGPMPGQYPFESFHKQGMQSLEGYELMCGNNEIFIR